MVVIKSNWISESTIITDHVAIVHFSCQERVTFTTALNFRWTMKKKNWTQTDSTSFIYFSSRRGLFSSKRKEKRKKTENTIFSTSKRIGRFLLLVQSFSQNTWLKVQWRWKKEKHDYLNSTFFAHRYTTIVKHGHLLRPMTLVICLVY